MRARSPGTEVYDILQDDLGEDGDSGREKGGREPGATAAAAVTELTEEHRVPPISYRQAVSWSGSGKWREALLEPPSLGIVQELPDTELFKVFDWMNSKQSTSYFSFLECFLSPTWDHLTTGIHRI